MLFTHVFRAFRGNGDLMSFIADRVSLSGERGARSGEEGDRLRDVLW